MRMTTSTWLVVATLATAGCEENRVQRALQNLKSPDADTRTSAARTLTTAKRAESREPLEALLADDAIDACVAAAEALQQLADVRSVPRLLKATTRGGKCGDASRAAVKALGNGAVPVLVQALDGEVDIRAPAAAALSELRATAAIPTLERLFLNGYGSRSDVFGTSRLALVKMAGPDTRAFFERALEDSKREVKVDAVVALGDLRDRASVPVLLKLAAQDDQKLAIEAIRSLGKIGDPAALPLLTDVFNRPGPSSQTTDTAIGQVTSRADAPNEAAALALAALGPPGFDVLMSGLKAANRDTRVRAIRGLQEVRDPRVLPALLVAFADTDQEVYGAAAYALMAIGAPAVEPLRAIIAKDGSEQQRLRAFGTVASIQDPRVLEILLEGSRDRSAEMRESAYGSLARRDDPRIDRLFREALDRRDLPVVLAGMEYYVRKAIKGSEPTLIDALESSTFHNLQAELMVNSGNSTLADAARAWAQKHGFEIKYRVETPNAVKWGRSP